MKNLLILGNGFDLSCGLKSSYRDFFEGRMSTNVREELRKAKVTFREYVYGNGKKYKTIFELGKNLAVQDSSTNSNDGDQIVRNLENEKISDLTIWDIILFYKEEFDINWCDVESRILEFLKKQSDAFEFPNYYKCIADQNEASVFCIWLAAYIIPKERVELSDNFDDFLFNELVLFETQFKEFLNDQLSDNEGFINKKYFDAAIEKVRILSNEEISSQEYKKYNILSFNYTNVDFANEKKCKIYNVHGYLNGPIIFGIDQDKLRTSDFAYRFSKTYRKLTSSNDLRDYAKILPNRNELEVIKFFGHSLSSLDYSYFQSIFDYYSIYDSIVELIFYFVPYGDKKSLEVQQEQVNNVTKLLESYGRSMDNKRHGKNLIHKLLLEGRVTIKEFESNEW